MNQVMLQGQFHQPLQRKLRMTYIILPNVPSDLSLLASGIRACSAGEMPEVPKGQGLGRLAR